MRRFATFSFWICTLLALLCLGCHLLWLATQTETGLETVELQWRHATWGWIVGNRTPIHSQEPVDQAKFWLRETDRVLANHSDNSQLAMGAALVLDSPSPEYTNKYLKKIETIPGIGAFPELDQEGLKRAEKAFQSLCGKRTLELAAQATELEPANVEWWRLRAILLWRYSMHSSGDSPPAPNWAEILDQCAQHDPDNALYDYLAADFYWKWSAEIQFSGLERQLVVKDAERFNRGKDRFAQGQEKPFFAVGDAGFTAVAEFLRHTTVPLIDQEKIVNSRTIHLRRSLLLRDIFRWQDLCADEAAAAGDVSAALIMKRQNLRLLDQYTSAGALTAYEEIGTAIRVAAAAQLSNLANQHQDLCSAKELEEIEGWEVNARLAKKVLQQAGGEMPSTKRQRPSLGRPAMLIRAMIVGTSLSLAIVLLLVGVAAIGLSRVGKNCDLPTIGALEHALALAAAFVVTVVVFGLAPSKIIPEAAQAWILTVLVVVTPLPLLSWIAWSWLRLSAFKFSLRTMLIFMFVLCVLFGLMSITDPNHESFSSLPFALSIPARGWGELDARSLESVLRPVGIALWAVLQWTAYYGPYMTIAIWALFAAILLHLKLRSAAFSTGEPSHTLRDYVGAFCSSFGQASLKLSALMLALYLALMPEMVATVEQEVQQKLAFARQPSDHWSEVTLAVRRVQSNQNRMDELREEVEAEMKEARSDKPGS